jgi:hypothetical protein
VATFQTFDSGGTADTDSGGVYKCENGIVYRFYGGWASTGITYSSTGWKKVSILQKSTTSDIVFDGQTVIGNSNRNTISDIDKYKIGSQGLQYYDDLRVRKYASPEPTYVIGSEESGGDITNPTSNSPSDASYTQNSAQTIGWILQDETSPGYYYVERNGTIQNSSTTPQLLGITGITQSVLMTLRVMKELLTRFL